MSPREMLSKAAVRKALLKELPFQRDKAIAEALDWAGMTLVDAYKQGAQEAQAELVARINAMGEEPRGGLLTPKHTSYSG